jgi:hypothetical protein
MNYIIMMIGDHVVEGAARYVVAASAAVVGV